MVARYKSTLWVVSLWVAALFLGVYTSENTAWYHTLSKPPSAPSSSTFSLFWALLYTVLTTSGLTLIHQKKPKAKKTKRVLFLYSLLFMSSVIWLPLTFFLQNLDFALYWLLFVDAMAAAFLIHLVRISTLASILLMPHLIWLIFATVITQQFLTLNH